MPFIHRILPSPSLSRRLALSGAAAALLTACGPQEGEAPLPGAEGGAILINVTAAAAPAPGGVSALAAMPRAEDFWRGVLFAAGNDGGVVGYDSDGNIVVRQDGPRFAALAAAPDFQLRGADLPLLVGVSADNGVTVYAFSRDQAALFEAPTEPVADEIAPRAVCAGTSALGMFDFHVMGETSAQRWRLRDTGGEVLSAERTAAYETPAPARMCAVNPENGDVYVGMPGVGIARLSEDGAPLADARIEPAGLAFGVFAGRRRLVVTQSGGEVLMLDADTLDVAERTTIIQGLSTPGVESPGPVAYSGGAYGGAYPEGYLAVGDTQDGSPKFIDRGYIGRRLADPVNEFAPGPAGAM